MAGHVKTCRDWDQFFKKWERERGGGEDSFHMLLRATLLGCDFKIQSTVNLSKNYLLRVHGAKRKRWFFFFSASIPLFGSKKFLSSLLPNKSSCIIFFLQHIQHKISLLLIFFFLFPIFSFVKYRFRIIIYYYCCIRC